MTATEFAIATPFQSDRRSPIRWLWSHLWRHRWLIGSLLLGAFGNAALAGAVPIFIGRAFDAAGQNPPNGGLIGGMALAIILSQTARAALQLGRNFSSELLGQKLERDAREELYLSLLGKSMTYHNLRPVGEIMARATNDVREINRMFNPGLNLVIGSANFILVPLLFTPRYDPQLLLAPLFFLATYVLALRRYLATLNPIADQVRRRFGLMNSRLAESIEGIETVKGVAREEEEIAAFEGRAAEFRDATVTQGMVEARFLPLLLLGIASAIGFGHALLLFQAGRLAVGDVIAYTGLLALFGFPTFTSLTAYSQVSSGLAGARRILELINGETTLDENPGGFTGRIRGRIRFENVTFGYSNQQPSLENVSFEIEPGQTVAVVGQTAAGKSSLAKIVNRTYDVNAGRVMVDGLDVREWNLAALRQQIAIIEQDVFLFSRTIAENIAFGCPEASRETIEAAARQAQAHDFITAFRDGYETVVGERGVTLSGGQRQRLALARALLTEPGILIMDDSTSAVDSATEDQIQRAIANAAKNRTTILITHRLSQIRWADLILVLWRGRLVAAGNHERLMATSAPYRRIFSLHESAR